MADKTDQQQAPGNEAPANGDEVGFGAAFSARSADLEKDRAETQQDGDKPSDKAPAEQAGDEQAPGKPATDAGHSDFDPYAGMSPEQRSHWERIHNSEKSNRGRVGALTKKLNTTTAPPKAAAAAPGTAKDGEQNDAGAGESADDAEDLDEQIKKATEDYGDVVGALVKKQRLLEAQIASIAAPQVKAAEDADAEKVTQALTELEKVHPDFREFDERNAAFNEWLDGQPKKVIDLANSFDPREVSLVLTLYKTERSVEVAKQSGDSDDKGQQGGTATDAKRARQLDAGRQVPGKGQAAAAGVPNDFSSAFSARAKVKA